MLTLFCSDSVSQPLWLALELRLKDIILTLCFVQGPDMTLSQLVKVIEECCPLLASSVQIRYIHLLLLSIVIGKVNIFHFAAFVMPLF